LIKLRESLLTHGEYGKCDIVKYVDTNDNPNRTYLQILKPNIIESILNRKRFEQSDMADIDTIDDFPAKFFII
jgi:hypothetical protein